MNKKRTSYICPKCQHVYPSQEYSCRHQCVVCEFKQTLSKLTTLPMYTLDEQYSILTLCLTNVEFLQLRLLRDRRRVMDTIESK